jgi:uncharacterized protein YggE
MRPLFFTLVAGTIAALPLQAQAQQIPVPNISEMAATPLVRVNISETLRTPPDEASLTVGTQAKANTATAAVADNKVKTERLLATIRSAGNPRARHPDAGHPASAGLSVGE